MSKTENNLKEAFAGESQANRKYTAFARKAEAEGFKGVAKLFKAAAAAETVHALKHFDVLKGVGGTLENLKAAYSGEHFEFTSMYPKFIEEAKEEKNNAAALSFNWANEVEKIHGALYDKAIKALEAGQSIPEKDYYICPKCGYTAEEHAPDKCPVCGAKKEEFFLAD